MTFYRPWIDRELTPGLDTTSYSAYAAPIRQVKSLQPERTQLSTIPDRKSGAQKNFPTHREPQNAPLTASDLS